MDGTAPEIEMMPADSGDAEEPQSGDSSEAIAPAESGIASIESGAMLSPLLADDSAESEFPSDEATDQDVVLDESEGRDSDVALLGDDESLALDADGDDNEQASVLADESGISLTGDSSLMLASESGISLEGPSDSGIALDAGEDEGITLALDNDSGISLSSGDSGISLEAAGDSGISLDDDSHSGTIPMMDAVGEEDPPRPSSRFPLSTKKKPTVLTSCSSKTMTVPATRPHCSTCKRPANREKQPSTTQSSISMKRAANRSSRVTPSGPMKTTSKWRWMRMPSRPRKSSTSSMLTRKISEPMTSSSPAGGGSCCRPGIGMGDRCVRDTRRLMPASGRVRRRAA